MPFDPNKRQYRSFDSTFSVNAVTSDESKAYVVEGYATTFDAPYELFKDYDGEPVYECIRSTALAGADMSDIIFQLNHEGAPLARLRNKSLSVESDEHGLRVRAKLDGSQEARDLYEAIANGLIDRMSWGFTIAPDGEEWDKETRTITISKVDKIFDVSAVSFPANDDTAIHSARSLLDGVIDRQGRGEFAADARDRELRQRAALKLRLL